jgi:hypothetical protein
MKLRPTALTKRRALQWVACLGGRMVAVTTASFLSLYPAQLSKWFL